MAHGPAASSESNGHAARLFIVCGRERQVEELHALFSTCGAIRNLHVARDRSQKSRGFAFLQYEDPACAARAIAALDQTTMPDGHVLKVTMARAKASVSTGKSKRSQHASSEQGEFARESEGVSGIDTRLPGKRQRSGAPMITTSAVMATGSRTAGVTQWVVKAPTKPLPLLKEAPLENEPIDPIVRDVAQAMITALELTPTEQAVTEPLFSCYQQLMQPFERIKEAHDVSAYKVDEEANTELLASSIGSVTLGPRTSVVRYTASRPIPTRISSLEPPKRRELLLRRRRQSSLDTDSSADDESDASAGRRKRSNTRQQVTTFPSTMNTMIPEERASRSSKIAAPSVLKKQCKREPPDDDESDELRSSSNQRKKYNASIGTPHGGALNFVAGHGEEVQTSPVKPPRLKLFFTATYKFTLQELEAMFSVYGDLENVQLVKSFGRLKTMAYVNYSKPSTASFVVESFSEESQHHDGKGFMKLSFADESKNYASLFSGSSISPDSWQGAALPSSIRIPSSASSSQDTRQERKWLLILFDRMLPNHVISSRVSSCPGMEFVDFMVFKSTGEAQGVAFVNFESGHDASNAALELHQLELPKGSGKLLQAVVISDPSVFSTAHGGSLWSPMRVVESSERMPPHQPDDIDLGAVEARFAHLMRSNEQHPFYPFMSAPPASIPNLQGPNAVQYAQQRAHGFPSMQSIGQPSSGPMAIPAAYHQSTMYNSANAIPYGYYPIPMPYQPEQFRPYGSYAQQQYSGHWMEPPNQAGDVYYAPNYVGEGQQLMPQTEFIAPVIDTTEMRVADPSKVRPGSSSSSSDVSPTHGTFASSILVSSSRPLNLTALASVVNDCPGVVSFSKSSDDNQGAFVVEFMERKQALEAVKKLDSRMCNGQKLRVVAAENSSNKNALDPGTRKRQRIDARSRK